MTNQKDTLRILTLNEFDFDTLTAVISIVSMSKGRLECAETFRATAYLKPLKYRTGRLDIEVSKHKKGLKRGCSGLVDQLIIFQSINNVTKSVIVSPAAVHTS